MELGKIRKFTINLSPVDFKEVLDLYSTQWVPENEKSGWCTDESGLVLGIDVVHKTKFSYPPQVLPKLRFKSISFVVEYGNPSLVTTKFTLGFMGRQGKIVEKNISTSGHSLGRLVFDISALDIDTSRLFRCYLLVDPDCDYDERIFLNAAWLEINTEA